MSIHSVRQVSNFIAKFSLVAILVIWCFAALKAQIAEYSFSNFSQVMEVSVNDDTFEYSGTLTTSFRYVGSDTLPILYYHAYFNAFEKGSLAYKRALTSNNRMTDIVKNLNDDEFGYLEIETATINRLPAKVERDGTIIGLTPAGSIYPGDSVTVTATFRGKVPLIIRRAGRTNKEGVRYSMAQWFPKLCQYDQHGWHNNQYVEREYYGVWGKYDVRLTLPKKYVVGATGVLQNPEQVKHGYDARGDTIARPLSTAALDDLYPNTSTLTWHFIADSVHDFAWVADEDYTHVAYRRGNLTVHSLHKSHLENFWKETGEWSADIIEYFGKLASEYPYTTFTCAQAGDGGMEYPNLIMITSNRAKRDFLRVIAHEIGHQWFYGLIANNETLHAWMDEGFTSYLENRVMDDLYGESYLLDPGSWHSFFVPKMHPSIASSRIFANMMGTGYEEPLTTMHDLFGDGAAAANVYFKGAAMLRHLEYAFGQQLFDSCFREYGLRWRFKHPYPADFERHCEACFGQRLDEFFQNVISSTDTIDYVITGLTSAKDASNDRYITTVNLRKSHRAALPIMPEFETESGSIIRKHIPSSTRIYPHHDSLKPWHWSDQEYEMTLISDEEIIGASLDTSMRLLDAYFPNNNIGSRTSGILGVPVEYGFMTRYDMVQPLPYYGVSWRPSVWMLPDDRLQLGVRADGLIDRNRHALTGGLYYTFGDNRVNWQLGYSDRADFLGRGSRYSLASFAMDDAEGFTFRVDVPTSNTYSSRFSEGLHFATSYRKYQLDAPIGRRIFFAEVGFSFGNTYGNLETRALGGGGSFGTGMGFQTRWSSTTTNIAFLNWRYKAMAQVGTEGFERTSLAYSHSSDDIATQFDQVPYRYTRFLNSHLFDLNPNRAIFQRGGIGFVSFSEITAIRNIAGINNEFSYSIGNILPSLPILNALELGSYQAAAYVDGTFPFRLKSGYMYDIGVYADIRLPRDLSLALPFAGDLSVRVAFPLLSRRSDGIEDIHRLRFGVGSTL